MLPKKNLGIIIAIILLIIIVAVVLRSKHDAGNNNKNANVEATTSKTQVPESQLPNKLPANIPVEAGAEVVDNYNAQSSDGRYQATRTFETKQTLAANLKLYSDYLKNNGWTLQAVTDKQTYKMVVGAKGNQILQISIDENLSSKTKTVSIILTEGELK